MAGIVFGTIRAYEYRLTPYILMHEPDVPITESIKVSREKTRGYKAKMFGADALYVVVIAHAEILLALLAIPYMRSPAAFSAWCSDAASLFGLLFLGLVQAAFYEEITHRRVCPRCGVELSPDARFAIPGSARRWEHRQHAGAPRRRCLPAVRRAGKACTVFCGVAAA